MWAVTCRSTSSRLECRRLEQGELYDLHDAALHACCPQSRSKCPVLGAGTAVAWYVANCCINVEVGKHPESQNRRTQHTLCELSMPCQPWVGDCGGHSAVTNSACPSARVFSPISLAVCTCCRCHAAATVSPTQGSSHCAVCCWRCSSTSMPLEFCLGCFLLLQVT